jgi:hypothetical protein
MMNDALEPSRPPRSFWKHAIIDSARQKSVFGNAVSRNKSDVSPDEGEHFGLSKAGPRRGGWNGYECAEMVFRRLDTCTRPLWREPSR